MNELFTPMLAGLLLVAANTSAIPTVQINGDAYSPSTLTITAGQTVTFRNDDDDAHTVTATDGSFDSKGLDTKDAWRHTFARPGIYAYFCQLHPFMKGKIIVMPVTP